MTKPVGLSEKGSVGSTNKAVEKGLQYLAWMLTFQRPPSHVYRPLSRTYDVNSYIGGQEVLVPEVVPIRNILGRVAKVGGDIVQRVIWDHPVPAHARGFGVVSAAPLGGRKTAERSRSEECGAHFRVVCLQIGNK